LDNVDPSPRLLIRPAEGRAAHAAPGQLSALLMAHGTMELRWYAPRGDDPQTPHDRDELYVVVSGAAVFVRAEDAPAFGDDLSLPLRGEERVSVQPGDALFVPAGAAHHFEATSPDFGVWVIFYGPEGGEHP
jgi:mannose-6-phosphate isomerase-like protein (cupin superfamily)